MYFLGKSSPTTPIIFTGAKKLAATAAWLALPPSKRGFSERGVLMESSAVEPTTSTLTGGEVIEESAFENVKVRRQRKWGIVTLAKTTTIVEPSKSEMRLWISVTASGSVSWRS